MQRRINSQLLQFPSSTIQQSCRAVLTRLQGKLSADKKLPTDKKQSYYRLIKEINWSFGKLSPNWPKQIERMLDNFKNIVDEFEEQFTQVSKGSSLFCGSSGNPKQLDQTYKRLAGYQQMFPTIAAYQDAKLWQQKSRKIMDIVMEDDQIRGKVVRNQQRSMKNIPMKSMNTNIGNMNNIQESKPGQGYCEYCKLMIAVSLSPNGYVAKQLVRQLPDTQWIAGILYEEGTIVDRNLQKAIDYYELARKKNNPQAVYRLGLLNQRGNYGKPYEYLKLWEQAAALGHLESLTDLGYLYENGLEDEQTGRTILTPDCDKALRYYCQAAEHNFPRALNNLATFYWNNTKYKDQKKCLEYFERAAEAEYVKSLFNLGILYEEGLTDQVGKTVLIAPDMVKAKALIKRAAEKGDIQSRIKYIQCMLADVHGASTDDLMQLGQYCRQIIAKQQDNKQAYYYLGVLYQQGYGVPKSPKQAVLYYTLASSLQSDAGTLKLGECYRDGFGTQQDSLQAIRCFEKVAKNYPQAYVNLGYRFI